MNRILICLALGLALVGPAEGQKRTKYSITVAVTGSGTVTSSTGGISCPTICSGTVKSDTAVTLTATPDTGATFSGWGGACATSGTEPTCTFTANGDTTVPASFSGEGGGGKNLMGLEWSKPTIDFGRVDRGTVREETILLRNIGTKVIRNIAVEIHSSQQDFSILEDHCTQASLAPNESCGLTIRSTPILAGKRVGLLTARASKMNWSVAISASAAGSRLTSAQNHTCVVTSQGKVRCWGNNSDGQLGNNSFANSLIPVEVCGSETCDEPLSGVFALSAGFGHTCALLVNGAVKCWGKSYAGALGNGTDGVSIPYPVLVCETNDCQTPIADVVEISGNFRHTCARLSNGTGVCWGLNGGRLGNSVNTFSTTPAVICSDDSCVSPMSEIRTISAGWAGSCAATEQTVKCWGSNRFGFVGDGTFTDRFSPVDVCFDADCDNYLSQIVSVSAGEHVCAVTSDGNVKCWGWGNEFGNLGVGYLTNSSIPLNVCADDRCESALGGIFSVSSHEVQTCGLTELGSLKCWGYNLDGELGDGSNQSRYTPVDVCADSTCNQRLTNVIDYVMGWGASCAIIENETLKCWGYNQDGQVGDGTNIDRYAPVVILIIP